MKEKFIPVPSEKECEYCMCEKQCTYKKATKKFKKQMQDMLDENSEVFGSVEFHCGFFFIQPEIAKQLEQDKQNDIKDAKKKVRMWKIGK